MTPRSRLAKEGLMKACRVRRDAGIGLREAICVPDLAERMGVEVRYLNLPSMEGMYSRKPSPTIVISSLRPAGRQAFTCGHELGHHVFGHGFHIDELLDDGRAERTEDEEFLVNCFAGFLLMPRPAVCRAFEERGFASDSATPQQIFSIACWLGVGYESLITHMQASLGLLARSHADRLRRAKPKLIRAGLLGAPCDGDLIVADRYWADRPIDARVGDLILVSSGISVEGRSVRVARADSDSTAILGIAPGLGRLRDEATGWTCFVRVSRAGFAGRNMFRHLEEAEDDDGSAEH